MTEPKVGDIYGLKDPLLLSAVDANGQPIEGMSVETGLVAVVAVTGADPTQTGATVYVSPVLSMAGELFQLATLIYPPAPPTPQVQVYDTATGLPVYEYVGTTFTPPAEPGFKSTGEQAPSGALLYVNTEDAPHQPPTHAVVQQFAPYLVNS